MKGSGSRIRKKAWELKSSPMAATTRGTIFRGNLQEPALTSGITEKDMMGSG